MERAWQLILQRLSSPDWDFTYDDVGDWTREEFDTLITLGLVRETAASGRITCDACPEAHWEVVRWSSDGARGFIPCPSNGAVEIARERLRQWRIDPDQLALALCRALELSGEVKGLPGSRVWNLGRRALAGRSREFFFAAIGPEELPATLSQITRSYGHPSRGALLLPFSSEPRTETGELKLMNLPRVTDLADGKLTIDINVITDQLTIGELPLRKEVHTVPVPAGTTWPEVQIIVLEVQLRIKLLGQQFDRSLREAGFGDRDLRLDLLKALAAGRGKLSAKSTFGSKGKTPLKTTISRLRQLLSSLVPIDGDPISYDKKAELYVCGFEIRIETDQGFPTPDGATWLHFSFRERRDGRLVVGVLRERRIRARGSSPDKDKLPRDEVAIEDESDHRIYSLEDLGLRTPVGKLTKEGEAFVALLRARGTLRRQPDDIPVLQLGMLLRRWAEIDAPPLQYSQASQSWKAQFECASEVIE